MSALSGFPLGDVPSRMENTAVLNSLELVYIGGEHTGVTYGEEETGLAAKIPPMMISVNTHSSV